MHINNYLKKIIVVSLVLLNVGCDQISKSIVRNNVEFYETTEIINDRFILTKVENTGAFLGFGSNLHPVIKDIFLLAIPAIALLGMLAYLLFKTNLNRYYLIGFSFIVGGGIGNVYDRIFHGSEIYFMHIDFFLFRTVIFNMAYVYAMVVYIYILIYSLIKKKQQTQLQ